MPFEECPRLLIILICHEYSHSAGIAPIPSTQSFRNACAATDNITNLGAKLCHVPPPPFLVFLPYNGQEEGPGRIHHGNVWEFPVPIVRYQGLDDQSEERVVRDAAHSIIGDACGLCSAHPRGIGKKRIETAIATLSMVISMFARRRQEVQSSCFSV